MLKGLNNKVDTAFNVTNGARLLTRGERLAHFRRTFQGAIRKAGRRNEVTKCSEEAEKR